MVIDYQDILGWDNFCFGLVSKHITAIQQYFLEYPGYKSLGEVWMSKVVRNISELQKIIWDQSNIYVDASNGTIRHHKDEAMTAAIRW